MVKTKYRHALKSPKVRRTDDAKRVNRLPVFGMSKNMELLELIHKIVLAHAFRKPGILNPTRLNQVGFFLSELFTMCWA